MGTIEKALRRIELALEGASENLSPEGYQELVEKATRLLRSHDRRDYVHDGR